MRKKRVEDNVFGKIIYCGEYWKIEKEIILKTDKRTWSIVGEIQVTDMIYEENKLGLLNKELLEFHREHPELINAEEAEKIKRLQKQMYEKYLVLNKESTIKNIEEAALRKREEIIEGETEESFAKIVGKEKAKRCFEAKTREEKLSSLELKRMCILEDCIEITCTCDWFKPSGGFSIFEDGSVEMLYIDSMSI